MPMKQGYQGYEDDGSARVVGSTERPGVVFNREQQASTSRATLSFATGLRAITLILSNASTAKYVYFVFNADNDADATAKIAAAASRTRIPVGESITLPFSRNALCRRIDLVSDAGTADVTLIGVADE